MGVKERQQMCLECNGRIPIEALSCPYCGAVLSHLKEEFTMSKPTNPQDTVTSLYPPPYKGGSNPPFEEKKSPLFMKGGEQSFDKKLLTPNANSGLPQVEPQAKAEDKGYFWPLFLLSLAANLFLLGFLQLCFSEGNRLTLQWNSQYWFIYCLMAVPCCLFGLKKLKNLQ